jgi:hypothetical protein
VWSKDPLFGAEVAFVELGPDRLSATGTAIGCEPMPYRLEYALEAPDGFRTARLQVTSHGDRWSRRLDLCRNPAGAWEAAVEQHGDPALPPPGGEIVALAPAIDPDLGLSPLFNTMPVLRHRIHLTPCELEFLMLWISVPDLSIHPSRQRYSHRLRAGEDGHVVRFEDLDDPSFVADLVYDDDGLVVSYPGIATRVRSTGGEHG